MSYDDDNLVVNLNVEKPMHHLFRSIFLLQKLDEAKEETASLKKKLEDYFVTIPEKNMIKPWHGIFYYSNGLCQWSDKSIILSPWELTLEVEESRYDTDKYEYIKYLKDNHYIWYMQIQLYLKSINKLKAKERISVYFGHRVYATKLFNQLKIIDSLTEEEKQFLDMDELRRKVKKIAQDFYSIFSYQRIIHYYKHKNEADSYFFFLNETEIKEILNICSLSDSHWSFTRNVNKYAEEINVKIPNRAVINFADIEKEKLKLHWNDGEWINNQYVDYNHEDWRPVFYELYNEIIKIEDAEAKLIFQKYGLIES